MKILKILGLAILVILILGSVVGIFLPAKVHVERSIVIETEASMPFELVNDFKKWDIWSPWHKMDTAMVKTYGDPSAGKGGFYSWESNHSQVGKGSMKILESINNERIDFELNFSGAIANSSMIFETQGENTKVTWSFDGDAGWNLIGRYFNLLMDPWLGGDFENGLKDLKSYCEANEVQYPTSLTPIMDKTVMESNYLSIRMKAAMSEISSKTQKGFQFLYAELEKQKISPIGAPFSIYHTWAKDSTEFEVCVPVSTAKNSGEIKFNTMKGFIGASVIYSGAFDGIGIAYETIESHLKKIGKAPVGPPLEIYLTDPEMEKDTSLWKTEVIYPIESL